MKKKIAIVGSGISGLASAYYLRNDFEVHLFEANDYFGGHTHTVDIEVSDEKNNKFGVDTGFLVFNHQTYPNLCKLFDELEVETAPSSMSFSTSITRKTGRFVEWSGNNLDTVFSQRKNLLSCGFWKMLWDIVQFNKRAKALVESIDQGNASVKNENITLGEFIAPFGIYFKEHYLVPMAAAVWSCPMEDILAFPAQSFLRFCYNHGLLNIVNRPQWYTVKGGAKHYVEKIINAVHEAQGFSYLNEKVTKLEWFHEDNQHHQNHHTKIAIHRETQNGIEIKVVDYVIFACHSPQSLKILKNSINGIIATDTAPFFNNNYFNDVTDTQTINLKKDWKQYETMLKSVPYQANKVYLHTDERLMPQSKRAWAAWNYLENQQNNNDKLCSLTYWINDLQPLPTKKNIFVTLNPSPQNLPEVNKTFDIFDYAHPVFSQESYTHRENKELQGKNGLYFCGAWLGYGFHEDGLKSALRVVEKLLKNSEKND